MSKPPPSEVQGILEQTRTWSPELRMTLAGELLRSLSLPLQTNGPKGVPAAQVRGIGAGGSPPPDDETVRQWIAEHRSEKHA